MQTEVLREFIAVARCLNFRKAAAELHLSQPALSKHIAALERELGFQLLDRRHGTRLTAAGERFFTYTQRMLYELSDVVEECARMAEDFPAVRVQWSSIQSEVLGGLLMNMATPFEMTEPDVDETILALVSAKKIDVSVLFNVDSVAVLSEEIARRGLEELFIGKERVALLMARANPLADKETLAREDLRGAEILSPFGNLYEYATLAIENLLGDDLELRVIQDPSMPLGFRYIPARVLGETITVGFAKTIRQVSDERPDLKAYDLLDGEPLVIREFIVYDPRNPNPNVRAFVEEAKRLVAGDGKA